MPGETEEGPTVGGMVLRMLCTFCVSPGEREGLDVEHQAS